MSVEWERTNQRQRLLTAVLDDVAATGDPGAVHRHPIAETFGDLDAFLLAAHARWATAVLARADLVLEVDPADPAAELAEQLHDLGVALAGARLLLDAHGSRPPLAAAAAQLRDRLLLDLGVDLAELPAPKPVRRFCLRTIVPFLGRRGRLSPAS